MNKYFKVKETGEIGHVNQISEDGVHLSLQSDIMEPPKFKWFSKDLLEEVVLPVAENLIPGIKPVADIVKPITKTVIDEVAKTKRRVKKPAVKKPAVKK